MIGKPTLIVHTTYFPVEGAPDAAPDPERAAAVRLGEELYALLTRPPADALVTGTGIPVRVATSPDRIDCTEAQHVVVIPVLGLRAFRDEAARERALAALARWNAPGCAARVLPVPTSTNWRNVEKLIPTPLLTELYAKEDPRRATLNEILLALARVLSGNDAYASRLFISHAKADLEATGGAADKIRAYVTSETTGTAFFDKVSVLPGEDLASQLDRQAGHGVFVAVRGDLYSSRAWCRRELLRAKQRRLPTLTVEVLSSGEARSATYAGNGPTVVWDRATNATAARITTLAMVESVRHLFFIAESQRVIAAAGLPHSTECLSRPPELLDVTALRGRPGRTLVVLHPDPPLPAFERAVLEEGDKRVRPVTPTTSFSGVVGSSIRAPLDGWQIALSLSDSPDAPDGSGPDGLTAEHVKDATTFLGRALIGVGAAIAYGGDFRRNGFTTLLAQLVVIYNETARRDADFLHSYLGATLDPDDRKDLAFTSHSMRDDSRALLDAPARDKPLPPSRSALHFSDMRRVMSKATQARVVLGGAAIPGAHDPQGYGGRYPGVVEEAWRTLEANCPLYVAGGFGGAAALVVEALESKATPHRLNDATWKGKAGWDELVTAFDQDQDVAVLGLPKSQAALAAAIHELGGRHLLSNADSIAWNGLTVVENRALFRTRDPLTLAALVLKGLIAVSTRAAKGKLRIELVEGDVTSATDLELLVFPTFSDLAPDGAGAALDRVSGGAATLAYRSRTAVPSGSSALGADYLYAADLGDTTTALRDVSASTERAADAVAAIIRRHGFKRVGVVTFLGNVAANLKEVVDAMVAGLCHASDTSEIVWFERDPVRAAITASVLGARTDVALTRRAAPVPEVPAPLPGKKRTVVAVRHEQGELDVTLLLHQANGLAPVVGAEFDEAARALLAGSPAAAAPTASELTKRGSRITELLFGANASRVLGHVEGCELVVMHDASAGGIPYEAMGWDTGGKRFTPATQGGVVRHLLAHGVLPERALTRPPRARKLGVLIVINPLSDLPGADAEGETLIHALSGGPFDVKVLHGNEATIEAVRAAIADPEIDVLHYCGHAFFNGPGPDNSGLNCSDGPLTLAKMTDVQSVPRLAFVNACQAGRVRGASTIVREPQAFAEFFLRAGVDAYLGTFWLVSDDGASTFAAEVYAALAKGLELGEAVVVGRKALQRASNNDWANYVLYGHAGFRLVEPTSSTMAAVEHGLPRPSVRVEGTTIVASWVFAAIEAPAMFAVAVVDAASGAPVEVAEPMRVDRREGWSGSIAIVTWIVTASLRAAATHTVQLRPSEGDAVDVPATRAPEAAPAAGTRSASRAVASPLHALRSLLDQQPDGGRDVLKALQPSADPLELRAAIDATLGAERTRAIWPLQSLFPPTVDAEALAAFVVANGLQPITPDAAAKQTFQTKEDWAAYLVAPGAIGFTGGDNVLPPIWRTLPDPARDMTHDLRAGEFDDGSIELALFSDNGNGLHASLAIAKQIVDSKLPYAFHLGDVYYGGAKKEFEDYFEAPLRGMFDSTELFMISGNHEMFAKGEHFQDLVKRKARDYPKRQRQRGEMFRLRGPGFQILGVDTMFVGWDSGRFRVHDRADKHVIEVLETWLAERPDDLTVLMTTNEPWDKGSKGLTPLYRSLCETIAGRVDLWFWGNVHYAALFEPWRFEDAGSPARRLVGSCIGHGGYPFYTENAVGDLPPGLGCRWLEKKSRFWPDERIRPDVGANGWCRLKLTRSKSRWDVGLTFVDWVGRDRLRASLVREDGATIGFGSVLESNATAPGAELTWEPVPKG